MVEETRDKRRLVVKEVECQDKLLTSSQDKLLTSSNYTLLTSSHQSVMLILNETYIYGVAWRRRLEVLQLLRGVRHAAVQQHSTAEWVEQ